MRDTAREATPDDLADVLHLLAEGRTEVVHARGGALWLAREALAVPLEPVIATAISHRDWLVQLASIDAVGLGVLVAHTEALESTTIAVVRELFVVPAARGVGLGELMMDATLQWATELGLSGVDGYALPGDRATKNFFERFGLTARGIAVHRSIG